MRSTLVAIALLAVLLGAAATQPVLTSQVGPYTVQVVFVDGLPYAGESTRVAVTIIDPETRGTPASPGILYISGGPQSYRLALDPTPTTHVELPALDEGRYDLRIQIPEVGATVPLELEVARKPLFEANPLVGGLLVLLGALLLVFILVSGRFDSKKRR